MPQAVIDEARRGAPIGLFAAALALSIALHIAAVVIIPGFDWRKRDEPARPLEVVLVQPVQPMQPAARKTEPVPRQRDTKKPPDPVQPVRTKPQTEAAPSAPREPQPLALTAPAEAPAFTVPAAPAEPERREPKPEIAAPAPAPRESVTPPSFDAAYLRNPAPEYPISARRSGVSGTVRLKVLVTPEGKPAQVELERSSGSGALDVAALEAVRRWQFVPARRGQQAIESWVLVPIVFKLEGGR